MSNFRPSDRLTGFLMPPSVEEWLPERHLARFVVEVIDGLDLAEMAKAYRGSGSASYHPAMLLSVANAGLYAAFNMMTRKLAAYDPPETIQFLPALVASVVLAPFAPAETSPAPAMPSLERAGVA